MLLHHALLLHILDKVRNDAVVRFEGVLFHCDDSFNIIKAFLGHFYGDFFFWNKWSNFSISFIIGSDTHGALDLSSSSNINFLNIFGGQSINDMEFDSALFL